MSGLDLPLAVTFGTMLGWGFAILGIGLLIFFHESGHFFVARWCGVRVEAFSLGFPPTAIGIQRTPAGLVVRWLLGSGKRSFTLPILRAAADPTEYRIGLIPLGGYVKMAGEAVGEGEGAPDELTSKSIPARGAIFGAGVVMNALTAIVLFFVAFQIGVELPAPIVGAVGAGTPAQQGGLQRGDRIVTIGGTRVGDFQDVFSRITVAGDAPLVFEIEREGKRITLPEIRPTWDKDRGWYTVGITPTYANRISEVAAAGAAAGFRLGDTIVEVNGKAVQILSDIESAIEMPLDGAAPSVVVARGSERITILVPQNFTLGVEMPREGGLLISGVLPGGAAAAAGLQVGERVVEVDGTAVSTMAALKARLQASAGRPVTLKLEPAGGGAGRSVSVTPRAGATQPEQLGVAFDAYNERISLGPVAALQRGFSQSLKVAGQVLDMLGGLFRQRVRASNLSGPVGIVRAAGHFFDGGLGTFLFFLGLLSVNLAILNVLPIPVLDGGHLFFLLIEAIIRRKPSERLVIAAQYGGLLLLLSLIVFVTWHDIGRLF